MPGKRRARRERGIIERSPAAIVDTAPPATGGKVDALLSFFRTLNLAQQSFLSSQNENSPLSTLADPSIIEINSLSDEPDRPIMLQSCEVQQIEDMPIRCPFCKKNVFCFETFEGHVKGGPIDLAKEMLRHPTRGVAAVEELGVTKCTLFDINKPAHVNLYNSMCVALNKVFNADLEPIWPITVNSINIQCLNDDC